MPIHDWTRVRSNRFHHFHQSWSTAICNALNDGQLPPGYFAMIEQKTGGSEPDVITHDLNPPSGSVPTAGLAVIAAPPRVRYIVRSKTDDYARKANRITIRYPDGAVVAVIAIVSPGNKDSRHAIRAFARVLARRRVAGTS
ncbi:MAG: hypothetical protein ACYC3I_06700 [Gemmataceae bacterium]